jgi:hypothetical protein
MTDIEIQEWLFTLAHSDVERVRIMEDLLKHAKGDGMTDDDKAIIAAQLAKVRARIGTPEEQTFRIITLAPNLEEVDYEH